MKEVTTKDRILEFLNHLGIGQSAFEKKVGISNGYINNLKGNIGPGIINKISAAFPDLNISWLLTGEGGMIKTSIQSNARIIEQPNMLMVPLISKYAYAGYLAGYGDDEYVGTLPKMPFIIPDGPSPRGEYISIEVRGDSMDDGSPESIIDGDVLLCRRINRDLWINSKLHYKKWNFVIMTTEGIIIKRITDHDVERGLITIHSLNDMFPDRVIDLREVIQIFNVIKIMRDPIV